MFFDAIRLRALSHEPLPAPLSFAIGCLASVHARHGPAQAQDLFLASRGLLGAIMEVDNRESRSHDLLMAVCALQPGCQ